ncbi:C-type lectin domain family 7 member A-like [Castor canadensis]|uniref:C-type lectin domain family 7 member A-like n=1 Tax=Castor canadensis TaxID=51338 RepID=A0AC58MPT5_CASCN
MSEEKVMYTDLKFPNTKKQKEKRHQDQKRREFPWHIVTVTLEIICLLLLLAIAGFGYKMWIENKICERDTKENNISSPEDDSVLPPTMEKGYGACQGKWSCCGEKCYYFSEKEHTWEDSDKLCKDLGSSLIKIDNKEEQNFIQLKLKYNYWIGLSRKGAQYPWTWQDGSQLSQSL